MASDSDETKSDSPALEARIENDAPRTNTEAPPGPSALASKILRLKQSSFRVAATRERLPQPLFWSLFHSQVAEMKVEREKKRRERKALYGVEW